MRPYEWTIEVKIRKRYATVAETQEEQILRQEEECKLEAFSYHVSKELKNKFTERVEQYLHNEARDRSV